MENKISIVIPMSPETPDETVKAICNHYNCIAEKIRPGEYKISAADPLNFFWLGMNFNRQVNEKC